jgi:ABC-2 type transport system ATP-binding protein
MTGDAAIVVDGLRKRYGGHEAVRGVSFTVGQGEVFALLGPNGAGKTTTVEILEGFRAADGGSVSVLGFDPATGGRAYRERVGVVLQASGVFPYTTPREVLTLFAGYYPSPAQVADVLELVGLTDQADRRVRTLSGGQVRRLDLALALIGRPQLLFLDEPTTGFDPGARRDAWDQIAGLAAEGTTVFLTTHYMEEAQRLADRVAVLRDGEIVATGPPETLRDDRTEIRLRLPEGASGGELASVVDGELRRNGDSVVIAVTDPTASLHRLTTWALERQVQLEGLEVARPRLEDVYLALTGEGSES